MHKLRSEERHKSCALPCSKSGKAKTARSLHRADAFMIGLCRFFVRIKVIFTRREESGNWAASRSAQRSISVDSIHSDCGVKTVGLMDFAVMLQVWIYGVLENFN